MMSAAVACSHTVNAVMLLSDLRFQGLDDFSWHCPSCTVKALLFNDCSVLNSDDDISVSSEDNISELAAYLQKCDGVQIAHLAKLSQ